MRTQQAPKIATRTHYSIYLWGQMDRAASTHRSLRAAERRAELLAKQGRENTLYWIGPQGEKSEIRDYLREVA